MASSALRRSLPRRTSLRYSPPHLPPAAAGAFRRSFQSGDGETLEEFNERVFESKGTEGGSLYKKLDRAENASRRYGMGSGMGGFAGFGDRSNPGSSMGGFAGFGDRSNPGTSMGGFPGFSDRSSSWSGMGGLGVFGDKGNSGSLGFLDSSNDGISEVLGDTARNFQMDDDDDDGDECLEDDFEYRPDVMYRRGSTYSVRDLDLTRPAAAKDPPRPQFETTTAEVLRKADFRNVRFLSNFLTEAGIIIKRSQTRISAKAQRKIAREIKTARAFGLMPFTTMGRRPFIFGRSAEEHYSEEEHFGFGRNEPIEDNGDEPDVEAA